MSTDKFAQFAGQEYLNLESYKRDGAAVQTPMWFADHAGILYVYTHASAGKVKRIRRHSRVRVVPADIRGSPRGAWVEATARIGDAAEREFGEKLLGNKYGWKKKIGDFFTRLHGRERVVLSIRPV